MFLVSEEGVTHTTQETERDIDFTVGFVVTERRLLFIILDGSREGQSVSLPYGDIVTIDSERETLTVTTTEGTVWEFPLTDSDSPTVETARRHLSWLGEIRSQVVSRRNDTEMAAGEMRTRASNREWDRAMDTYRATREQLDGLICTVQYTEPLADEILAPELADIERTLEAAHARLYVEHAESQLDLGRHLVENEDYEQARKVLEQAQEYYEQARNRSEVIERGDAFQFGTQRELQTDLEDLGWEIETVAAEPIRQAHDEKIQAQRTDDAAAKIEHWEAAFRGYGNVLTLEWGDGERYFAGDPDDVRAEMHQAAERLIELHERVARETWNDGAKLEKQGQPGAGFDHCKAATEHLERANELAAEFEPDRAATLESRRQKMFETLLDIKDAMKSHREEPDDDPSNADGEHLEAEGNPDEGSENGNGDDWPPSLSELSEMDTHHEITLDLDDITESAEHTATDERDDDTTQSTDTEQSQSHRSR